MDDFRIKISSDLDLSKAESKINNFLNKYNGKDKIKLNVDIGNINYSKQFESLGISAGKSFETALQKQINAMAKSQRNAFSEPLNNLKKSQKSYIDFWEKELSKPKNKNYGKSQQSVFFDDYISQIKKQEEQVKTIKKRMAQGFSDVDTSSIRKSLNKYTGLDSNTLKEAETTYSKLISLQKELKTGISDDGFGRTLSDKSMVSKWDQYNDVLEKCRNQIKVLGNEFSSISKPFSQMDAIAAGNKTLSWLKNNSKAAKDYEETLKRLAEQQKSATNNEDLRNYTKQVNAIKAEASALGKTGKSFSEEFKRAFGQIFQFAGVYGLIQNVAFEVPKQMANEVRKINSAQIELMKVSDAPTSQLNAYWDEAAESAKKYGAAINEVINSTADWTRLGYGLEDAKKLSDATTLMTTIGDNMSQQTSSEGIISTLRGFKMEANEVTKIVDQINQVANTQPIDTAGIFEGLKRSASSMSAANNTLEETIALITAANSVVQDPAKIGNGLKTISMRLRGATTELEQAGLDTEGMAESTSKLREEIMALSGVDIMLDNNTFKSTYQILEELSKKWKDLTDIQRANGLPLYTEMCA